MKIKNSIRFKFRTIFFAVFLIVTCVMSILLISESFRITKQISKDYAQLYTGELVSDINAHLNREIALALKASKTDAIVRWLQKENEIGLKNNAYDEIIKFNTILQDKNMFIAVENSKNFYFLEDATTLNEFKTSGQLSESITEDEWYFRTRSSEEPYLLNIDTDRFLKTLRVWINVKVASDGQTFGVIGTGLYLDPFIRDIFEKRKSEGVKSIIINEHGAIQMDSNIENIKENSFEPDDDRDGTIYQFLEKPDWLSQIETYLKHNGEPMIIELTDEQYSYVALAPIEGTKWHVVTFYDAGTLFHASNLFPFFGIVFLLFLILAIIFNFVVQRIFIKPFELINVSIKEDGPIVGRQIYGQNRLDEFGILANAIQLMKIKLDTYNMDLESKVAERTIALESAYQRITANETKLNRIFNNIPVGIFMLDSQYRFCYGNPSFLRQFGCETEVEFTMKYNKNYRDIFLEPIQYDQFMAALKNNPETMNLELQLKSDQDGPFWADLRFTRTSELGEAFQYEGILINIQIKKDYEMKLLSQANVDKLTGIYNRHYLDSSIQDEINRSSRYDEELSLMVFDLDHFKVVNDTWGHNIGDDVLKTTVKIVQSQIRKSDVLCRWGGEEFIVLLPHTSLKGAEVLANKIRAALSKFPHLQAGVVTASFGVGEFQKYDTFETWFKRTDEALFRAKQAGRNCVMRAESMTQASTFTKLIWNSQFESGNAQIDSEHQHLFELANGLMDIMTRPDSFAHEMHQYDLITDHISKHFENEEKIIESMHYPEWASHHKLHQDLIKKLSVNRDKFFKGESKALAVFTFLVDEVIVNHMLAEDVKFYSCLTKDYEV